jgi:site-specific DNA recombinase
MNAAIYARKSTDQTGVADDQKSVARQVEQGRAYAARNGWTVADDQVYVDDGISGAEFANRPAFLRLMNALKPKPPFQALVMADESRLGREQIEVSYALKQLITAGVRVFCYLTNTERTLNSPIEKVMLSLQTMADEMEREKARQRTADAMLRLARAGHVCGGRVFGYDNVQVPGGDGKRSHVARQINEAEGAVIRRIFALCAAPMGYTRIAKLLNAERVRSPRPQQGRPAGWSPSTIYEVLHRPLYRGEVQWNKTKKRDAWGRVGATPRPASDWVSSQVEELRIVSDELWEAAHARLRGIRSRFASTQGDRPVIRRDVDSKHLLSGFARCASCGGSLSVVSRAHGGRRKYFYGCLAFWKRGSTVCANGLVVPVERVDDAVLVALAGDALRPAVVRAILDAVFEALEPAAVTTNVGGLRADLRALDGRIANLTRAIEDGAAVAPIVSQLQARQTEREALLAAIGAAEAVTARVLDKRAIEEQVLKQVGRWRSLLTEQVADGRQLLREVLEGPLRFTAEGGAYRFEGDVATGRLVAGLVGVPPCVASPTGFEPVFWP